tara:strand:+ start:5768 stop:6325 length:558 start_codon:yes stop_codon:yes gene_type:complete
MKGLQENNSLTFLQRIFLILSSFVLIGIIFLFRGGFNSQSQLDQLARNSPNPNQALINGRPTVIEFYADWCEVCNQMAPNMIELEKQYENNIDLVLLNVDNSMWYDLVQEYNVNGIPHFDFFNKEGEFQSALIGLQSKQIMESSFDLLSKELSLNQLKSTKVSDQIVRKTKLNISTKNISPRSHG